MILNLYFDYFTITTPQGVTKRYPLTSYLDVLGGFEILECTTTLHLPSMTQQQRTVYEYAAIRVRPSR